ncbi:right-handed parallel beta-helix repeat-containing protein [Natrinema gelatinilyticum]|uniref:right-handed parallel beta-helix repeat-containing protein n=1 Tax=Natrinema gelatinilyticum TaxID=2961571 RepID=UPI0020C4BFED|nr:right-handed parallel beta-helix repeat-containing protein [Natrinema gelatinilyticum]
MSERSGTQRSNEDSSGHSKATDRGGGRINSKELTSQSQSRRTVLKGTAAACAAGVGLTSTASASSNSYEQYYDDYRTVVDVTDAGADNSGNESITPVLEELREDDTLLVFPEGRYYMDEQFRFTGFDNFGLVGQDATLVPATYWNFEGPQYRLFRLGLSYKPGNHIRFEGFDIDQTAPDTGIRTIEAFAADRLEVRDITIYGQHDSGTWGPGRFNITEADGKGIVDQFWAPDGGEWINDTPTAGDRWRGPTGIVANMNKGTLQFKHCWLGAFPDNGLYAKNSNGTIIVHGGLYRNSNGANVRVGGQNSQIRWPTVEVDSMRPEDRSQRGIRIENGNGVKVYGAAVTITAPEPTSHAISLMNTCQSARIENTQIDIQGSDVNHGIVLSPGCGETALVDTTISHETAGGFPLWIMDTDRTDRVIGEYLTITGEAGDASGFRDAIRCERDNCRFNEIQVEQSGRNGANRNAIVNSGRDLTVYKSDLQADRYPYIDTGSNTLVLGSTLASSGGNEAVCLYSSSENPTFKQNRLVNGIQDYGASSVTAWSNDYN